MRISMKFSEALERDVLGAYVVDHDTFGPWIDQLSPEHFYLPAHARAFAAIRRRHRAKEPIDSVSLRDDLGHELVEDLTNTIPLVSKHEAHVAELKQYAQHRALAKVGLEIVALASEPGSPAELASAVPALIASAMQLGPSVAETETLRDVVARIGREMVEGTVHRVVPTGIAGLDALLRGGGFGEGHLAVLGARPASGKSALAAAIAHHAAERGTRVLFCTLEMASDEVAARIVQSRATVPIEDPAYRAGMLARVHDSAASAALDFVSVATLTPGALRAMCLRAAMRQPYGLVVVDYLQLLTPDSKTQRGRYEAVTEISRALKALAMELRAPVLAVSQLSRNAGDFDAPQLSDLRESGQIEQDANTVLLLHRVAADSTRVHLRIAKQRSGQTGLVRLEFRGDLMRFDPHDGTLDHPEDAAAAPDPFGRRAPARGRRN